MYSFSILLSREDGGELQVSEQIYRNISSLRTMHPWCEHHLITNRRAVELLSRYFPDWVLDSYRNITPLAYRADLLRYCLLFQFGGVYADLSVHFFRPIASRKPERLFIFRDANYGAPWITSNSILAAPPGMQIFKECILKIAKHVKSQFYGETPLCPTGPILLGKELAKNMAPNSFYLGEVIRISRTGSASFAYLDGAGELVAVSSKRGNGLKSLGMSEGESYSELYAGRRIYATPSQVVVR